VTEFHRAIEQFNADVPALAAELRAIIEEQYAASPAFQKALNEFLALCQKAINPHVEMADAREMIIQHVLTEDIFMTVFDEPQFHRENAIARMLQEVVDTFYYGATRHTIHDRIAPYYETINARAAQIYNHWEKQKFLKALYEDFYRVYNPKAADRLGVIYTPDEIVRFIIHAADYLAFQHFGKTLGDAGVEILDPAVGTGTFITELIEYLPDSQLQYKYQHEIHCNEVAILPYYIANLNIEYTYKQKTGVYLPFENICFVDTLDNLGFAAAGKRQMDFFAIVDENIERIQRQNERRISVIIGNPPYNANQLNENENNKNREYPDVDRRIKETYIRHSTAQKTKAYDMYVRFYRWASDRVDENGIVAFVTNSSFLTRRTLDGFRKVVTDEFSHIYIVDLGGNIRDNPKLSGTTHNVFGIQLGVAIALLVKQKSEHGRCQIFYTRRPEMERASEKLEFLRNARFSDIPFEAIHPDKHHNWLNLAENEWDELIPVASKEAKSHKGQAENQVIFKLFSLGVVTNRDEWVYDDNEQELERKVRFLIDVYNDEVNRHFGKVEHSDVADKLDYSIKWTRAVKQDLANGVRYSFQQDLVATSLYRPFFKRYLYFSPELNEMQYRLPEIFAGENLVIGFTDPSSQKPFMTLASREIPDLHLVGAACGTECLPLYRYTAAGERVENITDWALAQFCAHYQTSEVSETSEVSPRPITKPDIFHYVYAVLHHPAYRQKYERNLKREFPRIPFYDDFWQWAEWGRRLMDLHLDYEQAEPYPLAREDLDPQATRRAVVPRLIARKETGVIELDTLTTLRGVPPAAWEYRLGTYSALEWVLERHKERTPKDPTIREKFNTYRFADYKEHVIDLLRRVCTVSVETMKIVRQMPGGDIERQ
jgi:predicted helicase